MRPLAGDKRRCARMSPSSGCGAQPPTHLQQPPQMVAPTRTNTHFRWQRHRPPQWWDMSARKRDACPPTLASLPPSGAPQRHQTRPTCTNHKLPVVAHLPPPKTPPRTPPALESRGMTDSPIGSLTEWKAALERPALDFGSAGRYSPAPEAEATDICGSTRATTCSSRQVRGAERRGDYFESINPATEQGCRGSPRRGRRTSNLACVRRRRRTQVWSKMAPAERGSTSTDRAPVAGEGTRVAVLERWTAASRSSSRAIVDLAAGDRALLPSRRLGRQARPRFAAASRAARESAVKIHPVELPRC